MPHFEQGIPDRGFGRCQGWKISTTLKVRKWEIWSRIPASPDPVTGNNWKSIWNFGRWRIGGWVNGSSQSNLRKQTSSRWGKPLRFQHPDKTKGEFKPSPLSYKGTLPSYLDKINLSTSDDQISGEGVAASNLADPNWVTILPATAKRVFVAWSWNGRSSFTDGVSSLTL